MARGEAKEERQRGLVEHSESQMMGEGNVSMATDEGEHEEGERWLTSSDSCTITVCEC